MRSIVLDTSILIDLEKTGSLENIFGLPYDFTAADVMFRNELLYMKGYRKDSLLALGLRLVRLDSHEAKAAILGHVKIYRQLTSNDAYASEFARTYNCILLTGDKKLRQAANEEGVEVHGHFWLVEDLEERIQKLERNLLEPYPMGM